jgi:hypothetical protein
MFDNGTRVRPTSLGAADFRYRYSLDRRSPRVRPRSSSAVGGLVRISGSAAIGPRDTPDSVETAEMHLPGPGGVVRFGSPEQAAFPDGQQRTADSLVATLATRGGMLVRPQQEQDATLGRIRVFLANRSETAPRG